MSKDIENIKDKIRKLLALAADPSSQGAEAETAGRQAAKLMAKFELDEYDLQGGSKSAIHDFDLTTGQGVSCRPGKKNARDVPPWIGIIAMGVSRYCGTIGSRGQTTIDFSGRRTDVELAVWLHNTLVTRCYEASTAACQGMAQGESNAWRNAYAGAIQRRLYAMRQERESAEQGEVSTAGTSLVLVREDLKTAITKAFGEERVKKSNVVQNSAGRRAGQNAHIPTARPLA